MKLLTKMQQQSFENAKIYYSCQEKFENKYLKDKEYNKVRDHCHYTGGCRGAAHSICNLTKIVCLKKFEVFFYGSNYDYNFIIKELAEEFKKQFTCLGGNTEKYEIFKVPIEKQVTRIDKNEEEITKKCILHFTVH